jgi:hypothetical protein
MSLQRGAAQEAPRALHDQWRGSMSPNHSSGADYGIDADRSGAAGSPVSQVSQASLGVSGSQPYRSAHSSEAAAVWGSGYAARAGSGLRPGSEAARAWGGSHPASAAHAAHAAPAGDAAVVWGSGHQQLSLRNKSSAGSVAMPSLHESRKSNGLDHASASAGDQQAQWGMQAFHGQDCGADKQGQRAANGQAYAGEAPEAASQQWGGQASSQQAYVGQQQWSKQPAHSHIYAAPDLQHWSGQAASGQAYAGQQEWGDRAHALAHAAAGQQQRWGEQAAHGLQACGVDNQQQWDAHATRGPAYAAGGQPQQEPQQQEQQPQQWAANAYGPYAYGTGGVRG